MLSNPSLRIGQTVIKGGHEFTVSEIDGDVIGLRHPHGAFAMYTTVDLVHVQLDLDLSPAATERPACSMPAPAGPAVGGTPVENFGRCPSCGRIGEWFHLGECPCDGFGPVQVLLASGRCWRMPVAERRA